MSRQYDAKQEVLKAYPNDRKSGVELFQTILSVTEADFRYEEGVGFEEYVYGPKPPESQSQDKLS